MKDKREPLRAENDHLRNLQGKASSHTRNTFQNDVNPAVEQKPVQSNNRSILTLKAYNTQEYQRLNEKLSVKGPWNKSAKANRKVKRKNSQSYVKQNTSTSYNREKPFQRNKMLPPENSRCLPASCISQTPFCDVSVPPPPAVLLKAPQEPVPINFYNGGQKPVPVLQHANLGVPQSQPLWPTEPYMSQVTASAPVPLSNPHPPQQQQCGMFMQYPPCNNVYFYRNY